MLRWATAGRMGPNKGSHPAEAVLIWGSYPEEKPPSLLPTSFFFVGIGFGRSLSKDTSAAPGDRAQNANVCESNSRKIRGSKNIVDSWGILSIRFDICHVETALAVSHGFDLAGCSWQAVKDTAKADPHFRLNPLLEKTCWSSSRRKRAPKVKWESAPSRPAEGLCLTIFGSLNVSLAWWRKKWRFTKPFFPLKKSMK